MPPKRPEHTRSRSSATAQQRLYVPAGTPLAIEFDEGMLEREVMSRPGTPDSLSSRSPRSRSPRARSRPVGSSLSPNRAANGDERRVSDTGYLADGDRTPGSGFENWDGDERPENPRTASADDWDNVRDGSISRRPNWRKPSTKWVIPFLVGITFSMGLTTAPRAELIVDIACLVHPPRTPSNAVAGVDLAPKAYTHMPGTAAQVLTFVSPPDGANAPPAPIAAPGKPAPITPREPLSPAARWFLDAQKDINEHLSAGRGGDGSPGPDGDNSSSPHPYPEIDPKLCKEDPSVASAAAQLTKVLTMTAGLLSALTTGFWAGVSDRIGRRKIMAVVAFGLMLNDICFLYFASHPWLLMRSKMYVLLVGPVLDGLLGGLSTVTATIHAYVSDVTPPGSRATVFSQVGGSLMLGLLFGPATSSAVVYLSDNILFPFYISIALHAITALLFRFLLPESLSSESRLQLSKKAKLAADRRREREQEQMHWERLGPRRLAEAADSPTSSPGDSGWSRVRAATSRHRTVRRSIGSLRRLARRSLWFLEPLKVLIPEKIDGKRDWNLPIVAFILFLGSWIMGVLQIKFMYAFYAFGWGTAQFGPYLSFIALCRGTVLLGIMPAAMYLVKPWFTAPSVAEPVNAGPATEATPLLRETEGAGAPTATTEATEPQGQPKRSLSLDLAVTRLCLFIEVVGFLILGLNAGNSAVIFVVTSAYLTLGSPGSAACNSLALGFLRNQRDAGALFGALAVLSALGSALLSPMIMANLFSATVGFYAPAIFLCASGILAVALISSFALRIGKHPDEESARGRDTRRGKSRSRSRRRHRAEGERARAE